MLNLILAREQMSTTFAPFLPLSAPFCPFLPGDVGFGAIRFSFGRETAEAEIRHVQELIEEV
jgi:hypothetical protein